MSTIIPFLDFTYIHCIHAVHFHNAEESANEFLDPDSNTPKSNQLFLCQSLPVSKFNKNSSTSFFPEILWTERNTNWGRYITSLAEIITNFLHSVLTCGDQNLTSFVDCNQQNATLLWMLPSCFAEMERPFLTTYKQWHHPRLESSCESFFSMLHWLLLENRSVHNQLSLWQKTSLHLKRLQEFSYSRCSS